MRTVLALGLLIALSATADAATVHHAKARHVGVHRSQDPMRSFNRSEGAVPGFAAGPARPGAAIWPPVLEDQTPSYDDPSKLGGG